MLDSAAASSQQNARTIAKWIGEARRQFDVLTDMHENELYDFLMSGEGFGRSKGQISREVDFLQKVSRILQKKGGDMFNGFDASKPLNIKNLIYKNQVEQDYDVQLNTLKTEISDLEKELSAKRRDYTQRGGTPEQVTKITEGLNATLSRKQRQYVDLLQNKGKMLQAAAAQTSMFDTIGKLKRQTYSRCIF